jgi:hypothetical protein
MTDHDKLRLLILDTSCRLKALMTACERPGWGGPGDYTMSASSKEEIIRILATLNRHKGLWSDNK